MSRNLSDNELEDAVLSIENLICKTFNESQRKFWKFCLSKYSYDVVVHCWHEFSEKLNPNEFPNWQHLEPIFRHYHNKINSCKASFIIFAFDLFTFIISTLFFLFINFKMKIFNCIIII